MSQVEVNETALIGEGKERFVEQVQSSVLSHRYAFHGLHGSKSREVIIWKNLCFSGFSCRRVRDDLDIIVFHKLELIVCIVSGQGRVVLDEDLVNGFPGILARGSMEGVSLLLGVLDGGGDTLLDHRDQSRRIHSAQVRQTASKMSVNMISGASANHGAQFGCHEHVIGDEGGGLHREISIGTYL